MSSAPKTNTGSGSVFAREPRASRRQPNLSRERIVDACILLLDREGPGALTMRKVAAELDVHATSLYWHVDRREDLIDLAVDAALARAAAEPFDEGPWDASVREAAQRLYSAFTIHPWAAVFAGSRPAVGPNALVLVTRIVSALASTGAPERDQAIAGAAVSNYVLGAATAAAGASALGLDDPQGDLALEVYNRVSAVTETPDSNRVWQPFFDEGLEVLLDGIRIRLAGHGQI